MVKWGELWCGNRFDSNQPKFKRISAQESYVVIKQPATWDEIDQVIVKEPYFFNFIWELWDQATLERQVLLKNYTFVFFEAFFPALRFKPQMAE